MTTTPLRGLGPNIHPPRYSGITLTGQVAATALVDAIDSVCREGGVDPVHAAPVVIQNLNICKPYHWSAYARIAGTPEPDETVRDLVIAAYVERCRSATKSSG
jgi:hypothetical protein